VETGLLDLGMVYFIANGAFIVLSRSKRLASVAQHTALDIKDKI
jgi:hypothetical protein